MKVKKIFYIQGRQSRYNYILTMSKLFSFLIAAFYISGLLNFTFLVSFLVNVWIVFNAIVATVKRLHDVNRSGLFLLVVFIFPLIPYLLYELLKIGSIGRNKFGDEPWS